MNISLYDMKVNKAGKIISFNGGRRQRDRLRALGLFEGQVIRKLSALAWGGPTIILVNRAQVAIGRGMAHRITIEILQEAKDEQNHSQK